MRKTLTLETTAKNISSCSLPDNLGIVKSNEKIIDNDIEFINTLVDVNKVKGLVELSNDAGKFVCNNIYYHLLTNHPKTSLFIHIPECNSDENNYIRYANQISDIIKNIFV